MTITITAITPTIGAEVAGTDLIHRPDESFAAIQKALVAHQVVFLRDQVELTPTQQIAFARRFGDLHTHPAAPHLDGLPEVFVIHTHRESRIANGNGWHTDVSCDAEPPMATMLQLHQLPPDGGDTLFASMYAAFESLSQPMRAWLATLSAHHASEHVYRGRYAERGVDDAGKTYPSADHPIVRTHPQAHRQALYVNRGFTTRINGLPPRESRSVLDMLFRHAERPEFQCRFRWTKNAIALWDNRCTQHFALWDYWPNERRGHRVTIRGERPFFDPAVTTPVSGRRISSGAL